MFKGLYIIYSPLTLPSSPLLLRRCSAYFPLGSSFKTTTPLSYFFKTSRRIFSLAYPAIVFPSGGYPSLIFLYYFFSDKHHYVGVNETMFYLCGKGLRYDVCV